MRGYGLPRNTDVGYPDVLDIQRYARSTGIGRVHGSKTAQHSYTRSSETRKKVRRIWKKKERAAVRRSMLKYTGGRIT